MTVVFCAAAPAGIVSRSQQPIVPLDARLPPGTATVEDAEKNRPAGATCRLFPPPFVPESP